MIFALVHYPNVDTRRIHQFREKYDPQVDLIAPHITLMFPVPETIGEDGLIRHLETILGRWQAFPIHLHDVQISADEHVYLLLQEGKVELTRLHDEIYTGLLSDYRREEYPFIPHVTLGIVGKHSCILEEATQLGINDYCRLDRLHLVKVNEDRSRIMWSREFRLVDPGE